MAGEVRFARVDGGGLVAYRVEGEGPLVVMTPLLGYESFGHEEISPGYRRFSSLLAERCRLVQYDTRGVGLSGASDVVESVDDMVDDLRAVIEAVSDGPVSLFGRAVGSTLAMALAARHPALVDRLAIYAPMLQTSTLMSADELESMATVARANWSVGARFLADFSSRPEFGDTAVANAAWYERSVDGDTFAQLVTVAAQANVTDECEHIRAPTALYQPSDDARWLPDNAQRVASLIDGASLQLLPGGLHSFGLGDPVPLISAVSEFFGLEARHGASPSGSIHAVLFSDIVGHTDVMARLGDDQGRAVIREHDEITRSVLRAHGGREIKTLGDGFMASFSSARRSVEAAIDLQQRLAERDGEPIEVRIGIDAGEPIEEDGDLFGAAVIRASRISALASGGEVLVGDTVRSLCSGKDLRFADRGETTLKGFDETTRLAAGVWESS